MLMPLIVALVSAAALFVIRGIAFRLLRQWDKRSGSATGDLIISALKTPSFFWAIAVGLYSGVATSDLHERHVLYFSKIINILLIFSVTLVVSKLSGRLFRSYVQRSNLPIPTTGLAMGILSGTIMAVGLLVVLGVLGISITPLLTALGVGGLAVALALKDTLENLFAGVHILMEKSVRVGDFIRLETGQEGYVEDITWRTTRIRMLANNMVVIPNNKLAQSIVTNYYLPGKEMSLVIPISVSYDSDIEEVERVLVEEAGKAVGQVPGLLGDPRPQVALIPGFGESGLNLSLAFRVREFADQYPVQDELRRRILKRFREEGIEMPYPPKFLFLKKEDIQEQRATA
jgi:small-conductance mechanosensitive channel